MYVHSLKKDSFPVVQLGILNAHYQIYLAMEARELNSDMKALDLISAFVKKFRFIEFTMHPADIPSDSPGKSSNISWAARKASERYPLRIRDDVLITVIDGMF
jgi:hypothetical protein